eukprot:1159297-Pelagomonas_calceolata.AAC.1
MHAPLRALCTGGAFIELPEYVYLIWQEFGAAHVARRSKVKIMNPDDMATGHKVKPEKLAAQVGCTSMSGMLYKYRQLLV